MGSCRVRTQRSNDNCTIDEVFATRERPHFVFADAAQTVPAFLVTAVSSHPVGPSCDQCNFHACSQCKETPGMDWTFTHIEPLLWQAGD